MQRVYVGAGFSLIASDRVAATLIAHARRVIMKGCTEVLEVPTLREDFTRGRVTLLLGPNTQIGTQCVGEAMEGISEDEWANGIDQQSMSLGIAFSDGDDELQSELNSLLDL